MDVKRQDNETFLQYVERILINKDTWDLDNAEIYELFFDESVSSDHARKSISAIRKVIEKQNQENLGDKLENSVNNNIELEKELRKNYKSAIDLFKDGSQTSDKLLIMSEIQSKDPFFLLRAHGYCEKSWELQGARNNIWNVYSIDDGIQTLYSSKITVKPTTEYVWNTEDIEKIFKSLDMSRLPAAKKYEITKPKENGRLLVVPIADLHYNLLSDEATTGNTYNIDLATEYYYETINDVVNRTNKDEIEKILFVVGNDFINADNLNGTTTRGTPQDNQKIWHGAVDGATELIVNGINMLGTSLKKPVDAMYVPSNHDLHTMYGIMQTVKAWYRNDDNVSVNGSPLSRKYYRFGKTMLTLAHDMRVKDGLKIVSTEGKDDWSDCTHMICLLAHLHQAMIYDKQGYLEIYRLPTISGWSRWTNNQGYVQSEKKNQSFIIDSEKGIVDVINTVL